MDEIGEKLDALLNDPKQFGKIAQAILSHFLDAQPPEPFVPAH